LRILPSEPPGLSRKEICKGLADEAEDEEIQPPSEPTVRRALDKLVEDGLIVRIGEGKGGEKINADPYRYHAIHAPF
jgi:Fe2+ or Zn2+ uptake regulation protein